MITLRDYQDKIVKKTQESLRHGNKRIMVCAPTGAGKTVIFSYIAKKVQEQGKKVLMVTHRKEILFQTGGTFDNFGILAHELTAKTRFVPDGDIVVAMVETLFRRMQNRGEYENFVSDFDLIIVDEGHIGNFDKIFEFIPRNNIVLGFSATPYRKGQANSLDSYYDDLIQVVDVPDLVSDGWLSKPSTYGMRINLDNVRLSNVDYNSEDMHHEFIDQRVYEGVIKNYNKHTPNKKAILFAASVESSMDINWRFNQIGIPSAHVDANTPDEERRRIFQLFREGDIKILCNVGIATMGFDDPTIEVVILYRATKSLPLFLQMCGRGSRIADGKNEFVILDFGNNSSQHGFWEQPRNWSLQNDTERFRRESSMTKECPNCERMVPIGTVECVCGYVWQRTRIEQIEERIEADLELLDGFQLQIYALGKTFEELRIIQQKKGYKESWILHQLTSEEELRAYGQWRNYKSGWFWYARQKFEPKTIEQREAEIEEFKEQNRLRNM